MPELLCFSNTAISLQGTAFFTGFTLGSLLWLRLTDFWGRKWMVILGLILWLLTHIFYVVKMSVATVYASLFLFGFGAPLTLSISFLLLI